jgi:hypothetical protein
MGLEGFGGSRGHIGPEGTLWGTVSNTEEGKTAQMTILAPANIEPIPHI